MSAPGRPWRGPGAFGACGAVRACASAAGGVPIRRALTADLPKPPKYPAKIVRHRLTVLLPPPLPGAEEPAPAVRRPLVIPLQNCDGCDRAFRSSEPGHCRGCRDLAAAA